MSIFTRIQAVFFARKSATPFGLMRIAWAATSLYVALKMAPDILRYFSDDAFLPRTLEPLVLRGAFRFTIFDEIASSAGVMMIYAAYLTSLCAMLLGIRPRLATVVSVVLLFSFHERNPIILAGGDTVLRAIGFILMISPGIAAVSLWRVKQQWKTWKHDKKFLPPLTMPSWPKRLLLWQVVVIYLFSLVSKLTGDTWIDGTAAGLALQNPMFGRFTIPASAINAVSPFFTYSTLFYEAIWLLLLIPQSTLDRVPYLRKGVLRRCLLAYGIFFHLHIFLLMRVGIFLPAMLTAFVGLLEAEDFEAIRKWWNKKWKKKIIVLHDGNCGLCRRSAFVLAMLDALNRLKLVNFRNAAERKKAAPDLTVKALDRALHVRFPDGKTLEAYRAFRALAWHLPPLWLVAPFLYIPGAVPIGNRVYRKIAARRKKCTHENCGL